MKRGSTTVAAAAASFASAAAMAQTEDPVTLYGRLHLTFESVEAQGGAAPLPRRNRVNPQAGYLGVRGFEDLGRGFRAIFQLETQFKPDQNDSVFANRNSGVGIESAYGTLIMGRWGTPYKIAADAIDTFHDTTIAGIAAAANDRGSFNRREQNVVQYWSPEIAGFAMRLGYTANEGKGACPAPNAASSCNPYSYSGCLTYTRGTLYGFYAYEEHRDQINVNGSVAVAMPNVRERGSSFGGAMAVGPLRIGALVQEYRKTNLVKQKAGWRTWSTPSAGATSSTSIRKRRTASRSRPPCSPGAM